MKEMVKGFGGYTIREAVPNPLKQTPAYMLANSVGNAVNSMKGSTPAVFDNVANAWNNNSGLAAPIEAAKALFEPSEGQNPGEVLTQLISQLSPENQQALGVEIQPILEKYQQQVMSTQDAAAYNQPGADQGPDAAQAVPNYYGANAPGQTPQTPTASFRGQRLKR